MYKTPIALTSELEVVEESLDNTLTISTSKGQATTELLDKGAPTDISYSFVGLYL